MPIETDELDRLVEGGHPSPFPPFCVACGYDLTGAVSERCPECGYLFDVKEWRQRAAELARREEQIKEANEWAGRAGVIALGGMLLVLVNLGIGTTSILAAPALFSGVAAMFLGLSVFRIAQLPKWTTGLLKNKPNYAIGTVSAALGALVIFLALFVS